MCSSYYLNFLNPYTSSVQEVVLEVRLMENKVKLNATKDKHGFQYCVAISGISQLFSIIQLNL